MSYEVKKVLKADNMVGRVYVSLKDEDSIGTDMLVSAKKSLELDSIYTRRGESPEMDVLWDALNRAQVAAMKAAAMSALIKKGFTVEDVKGLTFSRKAGCSCGCSPGFLFKASLATYAEFYVAPIEEKEA